MSSLARRSLAVFWLAAFVGAAAAPGPRLGTHRFSLGNGNGEWQPRAERYGDGLGQ